MVYIGSNSSIKEKIFVCDLATIGASAAVVKNIEEAGVYVGVPAKKIK
jgi:serine acetyltransferase